MSEWSAEKLVQRMFDVGLLDERQVEQVWGEVGAREATLEDMQRLLTRKEFVTNFQIDRAMSGERLGYFYGKYKVLYLVGAGSFARVYRAVHTDSAKIAAVKVLRRRHRDNLVEMEQFLREANMGMKLRHVNVVPIYEVNNDRGSPYMVMEFVEGQTLRDLLKIRKSIDAPTAVRLMIDVAAGLAYAAGQGITHRDLKLSNVLVTSTGRAKLVDFGLAAAADVTNEKALANCPNARAIDYATLERGTGVRKDDPRSDLFFAGCIFYSMLAGVPPLFETKDRAQRLNFTRFREIKPLQQVAAGLPSLVVQFVNKAMELDPAKRHQSPGEFHTEMKRLSEQLQNQAEAAASGIGKSADLAAPTGPTRSVMIVESNPDVQNMLRDKLKKHGFRVLIVSDPVRALARLDEDSRIAECVIFSTPELGMSAVKAFNQFSESPATRHLPGILFADERQTSLIRAANFDDQHVLMAAPLKVQVLIDTVQRLCAERVASS